MEFHKSKNNEKISFARYLIGKAFNPLKSIIDCSTFDLLFLLISWNISSGCQDALFEFEHSTCAPILSHENLVSVWQFRQTHFDVLKLFCSSALAKVLRHAFCCPRFSVLLFSWTSNQRGRHSKTFQHFLFLPWKTMSCRLFFKISLGKKLFFSSCFVSFKMSFSTFPPFSRASPWHRTASVFHLYAKHPIEVQSLSSGFELKDKKILLCFTSTCKKWKIQIIRRGIKVTYFFCSS